MQDYQDRLVIATPEGIDLALDLAGLGSRFTAGLIDLAIKSVVVAALLVAAIPLGGLAATLVEVSVPLFVYAGYDILFEALGSGRTPGKRASGLRVLRADGAPEDVVASLVRNVLRLVDGLPLLYVPGVVSILVTRRNQRLGDLAAGTIVVRERRGGRRADEPVTAAPEGEPPPRELPVAHDLGGLGAEDVAAVRAFLDRRDRLDRNARADVAERLAEALRPKVAGPFDELSPERFLEALDEARRRG